MARMYHKIIRIFILDIDIYKKVSTKSRELKFKRFCNLQNVYWEVIYSNTHNSLVVN